MNNRYDFIFLYDVKNGNPNGDPDAGNAPRVDPETGHGLVTDVCLKRKIRNYICQVETENNAPKQGYDIYVKEKAILNEQHERAYAALGLQPDKDSRKQSAIEDEARKWMCQTFFDIRMFGAVMATGKMKCGQVRGPVQLTFGESQSPIFPISSTITRMAVTKTETSQEQEGGNRTMGNKELIPYGLYRTHGFINPSLAEQTGFSEHDLELLWTSMANMFELDRSASRGEMAAQELLLFKHDSKLGNASAHRLFDRLKVSTESQTPRKASDYAITFDGVVLDEFVKPGESRDLGNGVTLIRRI